MKRPMPPPDYRALLTQITSKNDAAILSRIINFYHSNNIAAQRYLPWDEVRYREPPDGLTIEQWWVAIKVARSGMQRRMPLADQKGDPFIFALPDEVLQETDYIASYASGQIGVGEQVTNPATRDRYLVSQLIEEAITSSQLEGASTSRKVAREMIRSGRRPQNRSEMMILNNFHAMQRVGELREEKLTLDLVREVHRIVTEGTLDDHGAAGRFQHSAEERVAVWDEWNNLLHRPPPADQIPERMQYVCDFANGDLSSGYLPGVLRALTLHFMIGYEHPFEDGNGRTARALFYWSMLNQGYWLTEFLSVSRILKNAHAKYARSFLYTEEDENDLTYFFIYHLKVLHRAIDELHAYLAHKMAEIQEVRTSLRKSAEAFNIRQLALLQHALKSPETVYSVQSHKTSHRISTETARSDLISLEALGLLTKRKWGKRYVFEPAQNLPDRIKASSEGNRS